MASLKNYYHIKLLIAPALIMLFISAANGQVKDTIIKNIRKTCQKINTDNTLKTIYLENDEIPGEPTDGGSSLSGFVRVKTICKMDFWIGLSYCIRQYSYYLNDNGQLVFIYETERDFPEDKQRGLKHSRTVLAFEGRYYLDNGQVIDTKLKGKKRMGKNPSAKDIADLVSDAKTYVKLLSDRIKNNSQLTHILKK